MSVDCSQYTSDNKTVLTSKLIRNNYITPGMDLKLDKTYFRMLGKGHGFSQESTWNGDVYIEEFVKVADTPITDFMILMVYNTINKTIQLCQKSKWLQLTYVDFAHPGRFIYSGHNLFEEVLKAIDRLASHNYYTPVLTKASNKRRISQFNNDIEDELRKEKRRKLQQSNNQSIKNEEPKVAFIPCGPKECGDDDSYVYILEMSDDDIYTRLLLKAYEYLMEEENRDDDLHQFTHALYAILNRGDVNNLTDEEKRLVLSETGLDLDKIFDLLPESENEEEEDNLPYISFGKLVEISFSDLRKMKNVKSYMTFCDCCC